MQFRDLPKQYEVLKPQIDAAMMKTAASAQFISGPEVKELEKALAEYTGVKHCITCANGTDAITLAMRAWGIGKGDAVFVPDFTFFSSGECPADEGATPVFVDVDPRTYNMDPAKLEEAIRKVIAEGKYQAKAVVSVDLFGLPADYDAIGPICRKYGLLLLEDAAQGFGGSLKGKRACSFGDIATTSFFPAKPLGCYGDGGAIFTDNDEWADLIRSLCVHGKDTSNPNDPNAKYNNIRLGMNSRLDTLQAAILLPKVKAFAEYELDAVNRAAEWYTERLKDRFVTQTVPEGFYSSWAQYTILLDNREERDAMQAYLKEQGIPSMVYYPRGLHQQEAYRDMNLPDEWYPNTMEATGRVLSLPMHPYLTEETVETITKALLAK